MQITNICTHICEIYNFFFAKEKAILKLFTNLEFLFNIFFQLKNLNCKFIFDLYEYKYNN